MLIAIISFEVFGVYNNVAPFDRLYFLVFVFWLTNCAVPLSCFLFATGMFFIDSGMMIEIALLLTPRYFSAAFFTSDALTACMLARYLS